MLKDGASKKRGSRKTKRANRSSAQPSDDSDSMWGSQNRRDHEDNLRKKDDDSVSSSSDENGDKRRRRSVTSCNESVDSQEVTGDEIEDPSILSLLSPSTNTPFHLLPTRREDLLPTIPPPSTKPPHNLNKTSIPQTIINELNSESVRKWVNEQIAVDISGLTNPASWRLGQIILPQIAGVLFSNKCAGMWPEGETSRVLLPLASDNDKDLLQP